MIQYNASNSYANIQSYEITNTEVGILFNTGAVYIYHRHLLGENRYNKIIELAEQGRGLDSYLNKHCKGCYKKL